MENEAPKRCSNCLFWTKVICLCVTSRYIDPTGDCSCDEWTPMKKLGGNPEDAIPRLREKTEAEG